ncbi:MAG: hypothetical protein O3B86_18520, partial [Planctomycetota bacterium]|nr:hypothetical protein [Planctomycetota bacterium]
MKHFSQWQIASAESRMIRFGLEQSGRNPESTPQTPRDSNSSRPYQPDHESRKERASRESELQRQDAETAERKLEEYETRSQLDDLWEKHGATLFDWKTAPERDVLKFKAELASVLKLPRNADILVSFTGRASAHFGRVRQNGGLALLGCVC